MKKVFILIALLFTVVCFSAQPPDLPASFQTEDVGFIRSHEVTADFSFDLQPEVAFAYIGNYIIFQVSKATTAYSLMLPGTHTAQGVIMNGNLFCDNYGYRPDLQNSNYAYSFGPDYLV
jgi:hypothetical protein